MKIAVFADIHANLEMLEKARKQLFKEPEKPELVLLLGDNTHYGGAGDAKKIIETISFEKILALPGNLELKEVLEFFEQKGISLHGKKKKIGEFTFIGFGGGKTGNAGETNFSEKEIYETLKELCRGEKNIVLCTHLPPFNTSLDLTHNGTHIGSESVRRIIEEIQPALHLCAHCHEAVGEQKIGDTTSINTGAVKDGNAWLFELGKKIRWKRIKVKN